MIDMTMDTDTILQMIEKAEGWPPNHSLERTEDRRSAQSRSAASESRNRGMR